jgi:iron-sulfur cluster assembly protein
MTLTLTQEAAQAINALVGDQPNGGVRISEVTNGDQVQLGLAVAAQPDPTDQVVREQGSAVFIQDRVVPLLEDKTLDAQVNAEQQVSFNLRP